MEIRHIIFFIFIASAVYVYFRGKVRFGVIRSLTDYQVLLAPVNALLYLFSKVKPGAFIPVSQFPEMQLIQDNWEMIRQEALSLQEGGSIAAATGYNDIGFNSFFRTGWKRFHLCWYGKEVPSAQAGCPKTVALLKSIPSVKAAMFASLPPGATLVRHRDPYAGSLRYHIGLTTPNNPKCFIDVDGERYFWKDGEAVMFDETYIHFAANETDQQRIILFCDVERPVHTKAVTLFNRWFGRYVMSAASSQNVEGEKIGFVNILFTYFYHLRAQAKKLKAKHRSVYYIGKWVLILGILWAIFW
ncbi:aspartyl/asparaginyl beta-hydroxylase domain-containing protein [Polynucleobacter sp. Fuers-14]|nr:aspartyl/asparaginyl beta-hydroxylase domain-containing protein [Polynucleobacter sp. Fuers-14]